MLSPKSSFRASPVRLLYTQSLCFVRSRSSCHARFRDGRKPSRRSTRVARPTFPPRRPSPRSKKKISFPVLKLLSIGMCFASVKHRKSRSQRLGKHRLQFALRAMRLGEGRARASIQEACGVSTQIGARRIRSASTRAARGPASTPRVGTVVNRVPCRASLPSVCNTSD